MSAKDRILAMVQANPDIGTDEAEYVSELVDRAMRTATAYCALGEFPGAEEEEAVNPEIESAAAMLTEAMFNKLGLEGIGSGSIPMGVSFSATDIPDGVKTILNSKRRMWPPTEES